MKRSAAARILMLPLLGLALAACSLPAAGRTPSSSSSSLRTHTAVVGATADRAVPDIPLVDQHGKAAPLTSFRGKVVVLSPFMSLCQETCPITTGAFIQLHRAVEAAGLGGKVAFVEATVDPWRDSPARLLAYQKMAGIGWDHLLTGTPADIAKLWKFFGVYYKRVPEPSPPGIDWWTHKPLTYDVQHQDAVFFLDQSGHERVVMVGMASTGGKLPTDLSRLLDASGKKFLADPPGDAWTVPQALTDLSYLLGKPIPQTG